MHDEKGDDRSQRSHFLLLFCHADGDAHGKQDRKVREHDIPRLTHHREQCVPEGSRSHDPRESVRFKHRGIREGTADTKQ